LLEQRVAPREHDDVHVGVPDELGEHLGLIHPGADGADGALGPQLVKRRVPGVEHLGPVVVGIEQVDDVDAIEPEPLETSLE
jgi:hypothetical protein